VKSIRQKVSSLSGGQQQTVAIAKAVLWNSKVVILDEPTAALGVAQTEQVLELVRRLADNGVCVILISHNMNDVFAVSDNIAALYLGQMAAQVRADEVTYSQVVELITSGRSGDLGLDVARPNGNGHAKTKGGLTPAETIGQNASGAQGVQNAEITEKGFDAS
jgi:D-xylose transport system ATP-binding protein